MENLINRAVNNYPHYFSNGEKVVWFNESLKKQSGVKLVTKYISEVKKAMNCLKNNGLLLLVYTGTETLELISLFETNDIVLTETTEFETKLIVIK